MECKCPVLNGNLNFFPPEVKKKTAFQNAEQRDTISARKKEITIHSLYSTLYYFYIQSFRNGEQVANVDTKFPSWLLIFSIFCLQRQESRQLRRSLSGSCTSVSLLSQPVHGETVNILPQEQ